VPTKALRVRVQALGWAEPLLVRRLGQSLVEHHHPERVRLQGWTSGYEAIIDLSRSVLRLDRWHIRRPTTSSVHQFRSTALALHEPLSKGQYVDEIRRNGLPHRVLKSS
jgi:hypothetical protein